MSKHLEKCLVPLLAITVAALACNLPGSSTPTDTPVPLTDRVPVETTDTPFPAVNVYAAADTTSSVVATLTGGEDFAAISGTTTDRAWAQVDLGPSNTGLTDTGWIEGSALNTNGPCDALAEVSA